MLSVGLPHTAAEEVVDSLQSKPAAHGGGNDDAISLLPLAFGTRALPDPLTANVTMPNVIVG